MTDAGLPCPFVALRSTRRALADVALENMPCPAMKRDASSPCATGRLPPGSSVQSVCHIELERSLSCRTRGTRLARLPAPLAMPRPSRILCAMWRDRPGMARMALIAVAPTLCFLRARSTLRTTPGEASFRLLPGLPRTGTLPVRSHSVRICLARLAPAPMIRPASLEVRCPDLLAIHPACSCVSYDVTRWRFLPPPYRPDARPPTTP